MLSPAASLGHQLGNAVANGAKRAANNISTFIGSIARIVKYRMIRAVLKDMVQSFKDMYGWSVSSGNGFAKSMDTLATAFAYLRNSIAAMIAPLVNALAPALDFVIDKVVDLLNFFNELFAALAGQSTFIAAVKVPRKWSDEFDNANKKAKELKRTILGFDEINRLNGDNGTSSGSSPYSSGYTQMFEERPVGGGWGHWGSAFSDWISTEFGRINAIIDTSLFAVGLILTLMGQPGLGIGLMLAGAIDFGANVVAHDDTISAELKAKVAGILAIAGIGFAVGAVLAFSGGHIGLGIGLMIAGIGALHGSYEIVNQNWNAMPKWIQIASTAVLAVFGLAFVAGAIFAFSGGQIGIGIGLMIAGVSALGMSYKTITDNWKYMTKPMQIAITSILTIAGIGFVAGAIFAFSGGHIGMGIGLMIAGIGALGLDYKIIRDNWDSMSKPVQMAIKSILAIVGIGFAVGAIFAFSGGHVGIGIGLMIAGIGALGLDYKLVQPQWNALSKPVQTAIEAILAIAGIGFAVGAILAFSGGHVGIGIGLMLAGIGALGLDYKIVSAEWGHMTKEMKGTIREILAISGMVFVAGALIAFATSHIALGMGLMIAGIGALEVTNFSAREEWGYVNKKVRLAVEGLIGIVGLAFVVGAIAAFSSANIVMGIGMMLGGVAALGFSYTKFSEDWKYLSKKTQVAIEAITGLVGLAMVIGALFAFSSANIVLGIGLMLGGIGALGFSYTKFSDDWKYLSKKTQITISAITGLVGLAFVAGAIIAFSSANIIMGIGLMIAGIGALGISVKTFSENWDIIEEKLRGPIGAVTALISGASLVLGVLCLIGGNFALGIPLILAGAAGLASTISANWGSLEQLGRDAIAAIKRGWDEAVVEFILPIKLSFGMYSKENTQKGVGEMIKGLKEGTFLETIFGGAKQIFSQDVSINAVPGERMTYSPGGRKSLVPDVETPYPIDQTVDLEPGNFWTVDSWARGYIGGPIEQAVNLVVKNGSNFVNYIKQLLHKWFPSLFAGGGIIGPGGAIKRFANGGIINHYAGGTAAAHGTLFVAGEAGAEIVGNIGGRTEVLNKSQLAATMFSAVRSAMSGVQIAASIYDGSGFGGEDEDMSMLMELIRVGSEAVQAQNEILREQNDYLREINEKPFTADVSTAAINDAQRRMNRRAGVTVAPVG